MALVIKNNDLVVEITGIGELECIAYGPVANECVAFFKMKNIVSDHAVHLVETLMKIPGYNPETGLISRSYRLGLDMSIKTNNLATEIKQAFGPVAVMMSIGWDATEGENLSAVFAEWSHPLIVGDSGTINLYTDPTIVVVTDGETELDSEVKALLEKIKEMGISITVIGFGSGSEEL